MNEYLIWKKKYWQQLLDKCLPFITISPSDKILDAGCGPAGIFLLFSENKTTAYDPLIDRYENDLPHFNKNMYPSVHFVKAGLEDFKSNDKYDTIFCMNAINHVHDIEKSYDNLMSCGKSGSFVIITIDAHNHSFFKHLFRL